MSEIEVEQDILLAKQRFEAIKKQHEFQEFVKMDRKSLEEKSSLSENEKIKMDQLNAVLSHSESEKTSTWVLFDHQLQALMRSSRIGMVDRLTEPISAEDLDVVEFVLNYATAIPEQRIDRPIPLAHPPPTPEPCNAWKTWKTWGMRTMRSWFWDRTTTAGQLLTGVADLFLAVLLAHLFSGLWKKTLGDTDSSGKTATSNSFQAAKADSDRVDFDFVGKIAKGGLERIAHG